MNNKINFKRMAYSFKGTGDEADIEMYGDVVESQPVDWWTGEPVPGNYIIKDDFISDLARLQNCKKITLHIDSFGGDASASLSIHNKLREMSENGIELVAVIEGVAMSAATHIACACDNVMIYPSSLFMIHKCWTFIFGGYNADELLSIAKQNNAWDDAQVEIYKRKTNLSDTVIRHMMSDTTFLTGREAVEKGFCDELTESDNNMQIVASANRKTIIAGNKVLHLAKGVTIPDIIPTITTPQGDVIKTTTPGDTGKIERGNYSMAKNLSELRAENPELAAQVEADMRAEQTSATNQAVEAERQRLAEIDEIAHLFDEATVRAAKYTTPCTAQEMAYRAATEAAKIGANFMNALAEDRKESNADKVMAAANVPDDIKVKTEEDLLNDARAAIKSMFHEKKED